jgi:cyclin C
MFYKRVFTRTSFELLDPRLVVPTVAYLAGKVEECGARAGDVVNSLARLRLRFHILPNVQPEHLLECEFYVLQLLDFDLIVHHPYTCLVRYVGDLQREDDTIADACMQMAWNMVNDSFFTDIPLLYPPFMVAVAALVMSCVAQDRAVDTWLEGLNVNDEKLRAVSRALLAFFESPPATDKASVGPLIATLVSIVPALGEPSSAFAVISGSGGVSRLRSSSSVGVGIARTGSDGARGGDPP